MYVTWDAGDDQGRARALAAVQSGLKRAEPVVRAQGSNVFLNIAPANTSVRDGFNRADYEAFRREDALPTDPKQVIKAACDAYKGVGIIRNVIDLMADFACQGVCPVHPNPRIEQWFQQWWQKVDGKGRSERFLNLFYRTGNVVASRRTARLTVAAEQDMKRAQGAPDMDPPPPVKVDKREIPWRYTFRNPLALKVEADELAAFVGPEAYVYSIKVPKTLSRKVKEPKTPAERALVGKLPKAVVDAIKNGAEYIELDPAKTRAFFYKRDDWEVWASPMVQSILGDLQVLQKMKLADLAALDGAISCIRVWKLGDIKERIMPTEAAINRLAEMLCNNVGGGVMDLVWGPDLELKETSTDVYRFLGQTKYEPVLTAIYAGLGIPPTLTGAANGSSGGFTNNFISLKTMTERLQYGRDALVAFWDEEIRLVQRAMGFRFPAKLTFDRMVLSDEAAEKKLLLDLWDRNLISDETIRLRFKEDDDIETARGRREWAQRDAGRLPDKASPFHNANTQKDLIKAFVAQGTLTPSEVGLELDERKDGEVPLVQQQAKIAQRQTKTDMQSTKQDQDHEFRMERLQLRHGVHPAQVAQQPGQPGRPTGRKDSGPRKQKRVTPRASAVFMQTLAWAEQAMAGIGKVTAPLLLKARGKRTLRELTDEDARNFETLKFHALCRLDPNRAVDEGVVRAAVAGDLSVPAHVDELVKAAVARHVEQTGQEPTVEVLRKYRAGAYALWKGDFGEDALA
jgi:hypothetical protein